MKKEKTEHHLSKTSALKLSEHSANGRSKQKASEKLKLNFSKLADFKNEPPTDFIKAKNRTAFESAIADVRQQIGKEYPAMIGGNRIYRMEEKLISTNPCNHSEVIGVFPKASPGHVERAIAVATKAFEFWKEVKPKNRVAYLLRAAKLLRRRKHEFSAMMVLEAGKNWVEADADTAEAIDFMEFYAREALRFAGKQPLIKPPKWLGKEENELRYFPLGVGVILPPWNFPLAILAGMTTAAIVCGNTVVLKPAVDTPLVAYMLVALLEEAGFPPGVVNLLYGGAEVGEPLVKHPTVRFVSFTGSKAVGLRINDVAAKPRSGQKWIKRVVAEMGGKDAIIVDKDADLDAAAQGVLVSAFGYSGQKCSACSRAIIDQKIYDDFMHCLLEKAKTLKLGAAEKNPDLSAVSSRRAFDKILRYIEIGKKEATLVYGGGADDSVGYYIEPTIFTDVKPGSTLEQEEVFGPVLACIKAKDYDDALAIANDTEYGLTGAVYTKDKKKLNRAEDEFFAGNLYLNRKCTGALVGVHPFGGFNMSGTNAKAGGRDYLLNFMLAKAISRKLK